jgi:cytoskeletal protein CcmA (bactofilin family)
MWGRRPRANAVRRGDLRAFIDEGAEIEGKFVFSGVVMLNGKISGEVVSSDTVIVGEKGCVNAELRSHVVIVSGEILGNVVAGHRVELRPTARVTGNVEAPVVVMEAGARFEGHCRTTEMGSLDGPPAHPALDGSRNGRDVAPLT